MYVCGGSGNARFRQGHTWRFTRLDYFHFWQSRHIHKKKWARTQRRRNKFFHAQNHQSSRNSATRNFWGFSITWWAVKYLCIFKNRCTCTGKAWFKTYFHGSARVYRHGWRPTFMGRIIEELGNAELLEIRHHLLVHTCWSRRVTEQAVEHHERLQHNLLVKYNGQK
jgi:hypothetical protein